MFVRATVMVLGIVSLSGCGGSVTEGTGIAGASSTGDAGDTASTGGTASTASTVPTTTDDGESSVSGASGGGTTGAMDTGMTGTTDTTGMSGTTTDAGTTGDPVMTGTDGGTTAGDETTGLAESSGSESTTGAPLACDETHVIRRLVSDADVSGEWFTVMSMLGEGLIAKIDPDQGTDGAVVWSVEIPCTATWQVWVRYWDDGNDDSYFVQLDGQPQPAAIFEGGCNQNGENYAWNELNWRDPVNGPQCQYVLDPWTADWAAGTHEVRFTYRESVNLARIIVTNDPGFVPGPGD